MTYLIAEIYVFLVLGIQRCIGLVMAKRACLPRPAGLVMAKRAGPPQPAKSGAGQAGRIRKAGSIF